MKQSGVIDFEHILISVDGSENALKACITGGSLAKRYDSQVTVLHVIPPPSIFTAPLAEEYYAGATEEADKLVGKAVSLLEKQGLRVTMKVLRARTSVIQTIVEYANSSGSDLIVVGTRGIGGFRRMLVGSVSSGVVAHASCPVLVVRSGPAKESTQLRRILVAVDGSQNALGAARVASRMAKKTEAELTILHVMALPFAAYSGGEVYYPIEKIEKDARQEGEKFVAATTSVAEQNGVKAKTAIEKSVDSPVKGITDYAEKKTIDLIVVGTRGLGGFRKLLLGSVASGVVHYAHCSVLVVR